MKTVGIIWATVFAASWPWTLPAAEEVGKKPVTISVILERFPPNSSHSWTLPNGKTFGGGGGAMAEMLTCDTSAVEKAVEAAKRHHAEMKELIAQKKGYRLLKVYGEEKQGGKLYKYTFTFSDGSQRFKEFTIPLENVGSWDDFLQKRQAEEDQRNEQIYEAIPAGRYRLRHVETHYSFICRDASSDQKYRVRFMPLPKGKQFALIGPLEADAEQPTTTPAKTTWQEHLRAVRQGERKVLSQKITKTYYYEMILADGSKTFFPCGEPLK